MPSGLPSHLARVTLAKALDKALHAVAFAALLSAAVGVLAFMASQAKLVLWPALLVIIAMMVALWLNDRFEAAGFDIGYLAIGAVGVYVYSVTFHFELEQVAQTDVIWFALPKIAVVMVGSAAASARVAITWCIAGYFVAESAALLAALYIGNRPKLDTSTLVVFLIVVSTIALAEVARRRARKTQPQIHRAARDEQLAALRSGMELKAAALLHDTVLSHLATIANAPAARLDPQLAAQIRKDLDIIVGQEWMREPAAAPSIAGWQESSLYLAIQEARSHGLEVETTGDIAALVRIDSSRSAALSLAATQCLTNIIEHSGSMSAELAVYGSETEVSVMIIDSGRGFDLDQVQPDRLGLRASVHRRMESVGGSAQLWSTPGTGTSVLLQVPIPVVRLQDAASFSEKVDGE